MDYGKMIKFPMEDKDWVTKIIIGGILTIIPIVNFISLGYMLKVMKNSINKTPGMPEWKKISDLFVKGLIVFVIELVFFIIPLIIFSAVASFSVLASITGGLSNPLSFVLTILPALFIGGILFLIVGYL